MSNKIKKVFNTKPFYFVLGALIFGTIGVSAATYFSSNDVTYDNTESGLTSTNVQGAIDELYDACKIPPTGGNSILDKVPIVTSGDGLYKDEYEEDRYFYKGTNPNNYITFNGEHAGWRIISIELDGTIKIIKNSSIGNMAWDTSDNSNWSRPASLNTYLNGKYYNSLTETAKKQIVSHNFSIGTVKIDDANLQNTINGENSNQYPMNVGLATASEYVRTNSDKNNCGTVQKIFNAVSGQQCASKNWLYNANFYWWLLSFDNTTYPIDYIFTSSPYGYFGDPTSGSPENTQEVRPVIYLSKDIKIVDGYGNQSAPYIIE